MHKCSEMQGRLVLYSRIHGVHFPAPSEIQHLHVFLFGQWIMFQNDRGHFWARDFKSQFLILHLFPSSLRTGYTVDGEGSIA